MPVCQGTKDAFHGHWVSVKFCPVSCHLFFSLEHNLSTTQSKGFYCARALTALTHVASFPTIPLIGGRKKSRPIGPGLQMSLEKVKIC